MKKSLELSLFLTSRANKIYNITKITKANTAFFNHNFLLSCKCAFHLNCLDWHSQRQRPSLKGLAPISFIRKWASLSSRRKIIFKGQGGRKVWKQSDKVQPWKLHSVITNRLCQKENELYKSQNKHLKDLIFRN